MHTTIDSSSYTPFAVTVVPHRHEVVIVPVGELDMASIDEVDHAVRELRDSGFQSIVLDLRGIDFIDSSGLRLLISLRNNSKRDGHALNLMAPSAAVSRIFDITRTRGLFDWRERPR